VQRIKSCRRQLSKPSQVSRPAFNLAVIRHRGEGQAEMRQSRLPQPDSEMAQRQAGIGRHRFLLGPLLPEVQGGRGGVELISGEHFQNEAHAAVVHRFQNFFLISGFAVIENLMRPSRLAISRPFGVPTVARTFRPLHATFSSLEAWQMSNTPTIRRGALMPSPTSAHSSLASERTFDTKIVNLGHKKAQGCSYAALGRWGEHRVPRNRETLADYLRRLPA
jgi:hypothetical protein